MTQSQPLDNGAQHPLCHGQRTLVGTKWAWLDYFSLGLWGKAQGVLPSPGCLLFDEANMVGSTEVRRKEDTALSLYEVQLEFIYFQWNKCSRVGIIEGWKENFLFPLEADWSSGDGLVRINVNKTMWFSGGTRGWRSVLFICKMGMLS